MKIGALVPARIGSKRLPKKNIRMLGGKPLICWTIDTLLKADVFSDITVSTESDEVAEVIRSRYDPKDVSILKRPVELAGDDSPLSAVKDHYLNHRPNMEWYGLFMPTMPFRKVETLKRIQAAICSGHPWVVKTCTTQTYPIMDFYYPVADGVKRFFNEPCFYARMMHCIYMLERKDAHPSLWPEYGLSPAERVFLVHADEKECVDIDTMEDFAKAEKICDGKKMVLQNLEFHFIENWRLVAPKGTDFSKFALFLKEKTSCTDHPILLLEKPHPPLTFLSLSDGAQRRPWISPAAAKYLHSLKLQQTGNLQFMPPHFFHTPYYRVQRDFGIKNYKKLLETDAWGGLHGWDGSTIPMDRVVLLEDLKKQSFWNDPYIWI